MSHCFGMAATLTILVLVPACQPPSDRSRGEASAEPVEVTVVEVVPQNSAIPFFFVLGISESQIQN